MGWGRDRTVLVMWEYSCDHSPVWSRGDDTDVGNLDVRDLGVGDGLREDLADWNRRCEVAADPDDLLPAATTDAGWRALTGEAFPLAARLQRALGEEWTVWCCSGGGDGGLRDRAFLRLLGEQLLLRPFGLVRWTPDGTEPAAALLTEGLRQQLRAWVGGAGRLPRVEVRGTALELAGRIHGPLPSGTVRWFGGGDVP